MGTRQVKCPSCQATLSLPEGAADQAVRCGRCRTPFRVPLPEPVPDDTVFDWLHEGAGEDDGAGSAAAGPGAVETVGGREGIRLVSVDRRGVLIEFPASRLLEEGFRLAMPHVCAHCLSRAHLLAHLVIFRPSVRGRVSLDAEHDAGRLIFSEDQLGDLRGSELLAWLPKVPSVPHPGDLPMPYWICNLCQGAKAISGRIEVSSATGRGLCRLLVRNPQLAAGFFAAAGGEGTPGQLQLQRFLARIEEDRWGALRPAVRHRLEQWFRVGKDEQFLAYVPDRARARTEDGMSGLVISTGRLVYHRPPLHEELPVDTGLEVQVRYSGGRGIAILNAPGLKRRSITLDHRGLRLFRRALSKAHFNATWR